MNIKVSVVIPTYNEADSILEILNRVNKVTVSGFEFEIIVIDDGSTDNTYKLLKGRSDLYAKLIQKKENGGKGAAVKSGLEKATGKYVLFQDADLEYDPADFVKLLEPVRRFKADLVMGSRLTGSSITRVSYFWHKVGNKLITLIFNVLNNTSFTDIYSCYLLYQRDLVNPKVLRSSGWSQHAEILGEAKQRANSIFEVPVNYYGRSYSEGKKIRGYHIISILWMIAKKRFFN